MKRNLYYFFVVLFSLAACTPSPAGQGQAATATNEPTATIVPTNTPEPSPTPDIRFAELIPATLEECKEKNILRWDHLEEDMQKVLDKERELGLSIDDAGLYSTGIPENDFEKTQSPYISPGHFSSLHFPFIQSCSYIKEKGLFVFGIPIRFLGPYNENDKFGFFHFSVDESAEEIFWNKKGTPDRFQKYFELDTIYPKIKNREYESLVLATIGENRYAERDGEWSNILDVYFNHLNDEERRLEIWLAYGTGIPQEKMNDLINKMQNKVIPVVFLGL